MRLWEMVMTRFFLAKLAKQVYAFDIQKQALEKTKSVCIRLAWQMPS